MTTQAKICGLKTPETIHAAVQAGVDHIGLVFFPKSPRNVSIEEAAMLASRIPSNVNIVGLFVEPDDQLIDRVLEAVPLDIIQLHGKEPVERVVQIKQRTGRQVMKAIGIREAEDLEAVSQYEPVVDWLLLDAKPPKDATLPGGNAIAFDWTLLEGKSFSKPWMLAGGLTPDNVQTAIRMTGAPCVDASSGLEDAPGEKSPHKIREFMKAVKSA
ncbi:phosphoribosylanthranilate isomerase [Curvivirga sp.]|uniref:phosphoribosylanthranilate isomerase n=1 Tax=Curvivirga sp. TaxID=2856848 RepID=UPI003B5BAB65